MNSSSDVPGIFDGDWWLAYGLQGLVGAVMGGAIAGYVAMRVLKRTLAHERELVGEQRDHEHAQALELIERERRQAAEVATRQVAGELQLVLADLISGLTISRSDPLNWPPFRQALALAGRLAAEARVDWPELATWVGRYAHNARTFAPWKPSVSQQDLITALNTLNNAVSHWFQDPEGYRASADDRDPPKPF